MILKSRDYKKLYKTNSYKKSVYIKSTIDIFGVEFIHLFVQKAKVMNSLFLIYFIKTNIAFWWREKTI